MDGRLDPEDSIASSNSPEKDQKLSSFERHLLDASSFEKVKKIDYVKHKIVD